MSTIASPSSLSPQEHRTLLHILRSSNRRYDTIAKTNRKIVHLQSSNHAQHHAQHLGLTIEVQRAQKCPQSAVSRIPLPILERGGPMERPALPPLVIPRYIAQRNVDYEEKPLPPLPVPSDVQVDAHEPAITDEYWSLPSSGALPSSERFFPTLSGVFIDCEELEWIFEDVNLDSAAVEGDAGVGILSASSSWTSDESTSLTTASSSNSSELITPEQENLFLLGSKRKQMSCATQRYERPPKIFRDDLYLPCT